MVLALDSGLVGILVACVAAIPGGFAYLASRRTGNSDVFIRRDENSWMRMVASRDQADADLATLRADFIARGVELAEVREHARRCDEALGEERERSDRQEARGDRLESELAVLRERLDKGGVT